MVMIYISIIASFFFISENIDSGQKVRKGRILEEVNMYTTLPKHVELGIKGNPPYLNISPIAYRLSMMFISIFVSEFCNLFNLFL